MYKKNAFQSFDAKSKKSFLENAISVMTVNIPPSLNTDSYRISNIKITEVDTEQLLLK